MDKGLAAILRSRPRIPVRTGATHQVDAGLAAILSSRKPVEISLRVGGLLDGIFPPGDPSTPVADPWGINGPLMARKIAVHEKFEAMRARVYQARALLSSQENTDWEQLYQEWFAFAWATPPATDAEKRLYDYEVRLKPWEVRLDALENRGGSNAGSSKLPWIVGGAVAVGLVAFAARR